MSYIVIEIHGGPQYATIVTDQDGANKVFEIEAEAMEEALDCQDGSVIEV